MAEHQSFKLSNFLYQYQDQMFWILHLLLKLKEENSKIYVNKEDSNLIYSTLIKMGYSIIQFIWRLI